MSLTQSKNQSPKTKATTNTKQKLQEDALAFANLLYDIFKERQLNANVEHDQNSKSYTTEEK